MSPVSIPGNAAIRLLVPESVKRLTWNHKQCQAGFAIPMKNPGNWKNKKVFLMGFLFSYWGFMLLVTVQVWVSPAFMLPTKCLHHHKILGYNLLIPIEKCESGPEVFLSKTILTFRY